MRTLFSLLLLAGTIVAAEPPKPTTTLKLWPGKAPGDPDGLALEKLTPAANGKVTTVTNVNEPLVDIFLPPKDKATGVFILVAPGGGYNLLAIEHEGTDVATWLNSKGIAAGVLKYRVPRRKDVSPEFKPMLQDAQRAMGLVRSKAKEWGIDEKKIGMLGFSAGGHLTAVTSTMTDKREYDTVDGTDKLASRPDFAILIYPGGLVEKDTATLKADFKITKATPPMFFVHASNDNVSSENSIALYRELKKNSVPAEMHLYATGGHGFGMRKGSAVSDWPTRCEEWLRTRGILPK
ncbi:alpha/beta hydrolase [soil metagenome]